MKKLWFVLLVFTIVFVGCSNPTSGSTEKTPVENKPTSTTPQGTPTPVVDKSPFEYVKPDCVNLADYTYVGDYIFADSMNFAEWKYSNAETNYMLAFEKIARVKNENPLTQIWRCYHDTKIDYAVVKATKYKIYVQTSVVEATNVSNFVLNVHNKGLAENYDGSQLRIKKFLMIQLHLLYLNLLVNYLIM